MLKHFEKHIASLDQDLLKLIQKRSAIFHAVSAFIYISIVVTLSYKNEIWVFLHIPLTVLVSFFLGKYLAFLFIPIPKLKFLLLPYLNYTLISFLTAISSMSIFNCVAELLINGFNVHDLTQAFLNGLGAGMFGSLITFPITLLVGLNLGGLLYKTALFEIEDKNKKQHQ